MVGIFSGAPPSDPAKLVSAEVARHVIATAALLYFRLAHRTERYVLLSSVGRLEDPLKVLLTRFALMVCVPAREARLGLAERALDVLDPVVCGNHLTLAVGFSAVAQELVGVVFPACAPLIQLRQQVGFLNE